MKVVSIAEFVIFRTIGIQQSLLQALKRLYSGIQIDSESYLTLKMFSLEDVHLVKPWIVNYVDTAFMHKSGASGLAHILPLHHHVDVDGAAARRARVRCCH